MANVYVEARPKGRPEGTHIDDYVVEDHADHVLGKLREQESMGRIPMVTIPLSLASGTSITRRILTIGGQPKRR